MRERTLRISAFARRCMLEIVRDPLSYVFSLGFPLAMLAVMTALNSSVPPEAGMTIFELKSLIPAVYVFGLSFLMLFTAQLVSRDRCGAYLTRLYISPMSGFDFLLGYTVPVFVLAVLQGVITMTAGGMIAVISGEDVKISGMLLAILVSVPSALMFIGFGLLLGVSFGERSAPPVSSAIISTASLFGGMWMDIDSMSGVIAKISHVLPFYHAVRIGRAAMSMNLTDTAVSFAVIFVWAAAVFIICSRVGFSQEH